MSLIQKAIDLSAKFFTIAVLAMLTIMLAMAKNDIVVSPVFAIVFFVCLLMMVSARLYLICTTPETHLN